MAAKIKKGDTVMVLVGKYKGKTGEVLSVSPKENKVLIAGVNIVKKHKKPTMNSQGQIVEVEKPIHISNVSLIEDGQAEVCCQFCGAKYNFTKAELEHLLKLADSVK